MGQQLVLTRIYYDNFLSSFKGKNLHQKVKICIKRSKSTRIRKPSLGQPVWWDANFDNKFKFDNESKCWMDDF